MVRACLLAASGWSSRPSGPLAPQASACVSHAVYTGSGTSASLSPPVSPFPSRCQHTSAHVISGAGTGRGWEGGCSSPRLVTLCPVLPASLQHCLGTGSSAQQVRESGFRACPFLRQPWAGSHLRRARSPSWPVKAHLGARSLDPPDGCLIPFWAGRTRGNPQRCSACDQGLLPGTPPPKE